MPSSERDPREWPGSDSTESETEGSGPSREAEERSLDASDAPVTCAQWAKPEGAMTSSLALLSGAAVPLPDGLDTVALVGSPNRVGLSPGTGYFVDSNSALFWVSDTGVRYGVEDAKTAAALGLTAEPLPVPWSILSQFAAGPTLSRADALLAHDALPPDPNPAGRENP